MVYTKCKGRLTGGGGKYSNADNDNGEYLELDPPNHVKFTWENAKHCPGTIVDVEFDSIDSGQIEICLKHSLLATAQHVNDMKMGWSWALDSVASYLETGNPITFEKWKEQQ